MKWLLKKMMPSAETIAKMAAAQVKEWVNALPEDRAQQIAKGSAAVEEANKVIAAVTKWLADGKMDDEEVRELQRALLPLIETIMKRI